MIYIKPIGDFGEQLFLLGAALRLSKYRLDMIRVDMSESQNQHFSISTLCGDNLFPKPVETGEIEGKIKSGRVKLLDESVLGPAAADQALNLNLDIDSSDFLIRGEYKNGLNLLAIKKILTGRMQEIENETEIADSSTGVIHFCQKVVHKSPENTSRNINLSYLDRVINIIRPECVKIEIYSEIVGILGEYESKPNINLRIIEDGFDALKKFMSAKTLIISNSSFSLSAAYLSNCNTKLIRPAVWDPNEFEDFLTDKIKSNVVYVPNTFY